MGQIKAELVRKDGQSHSEAKNRPQLSGAVQGLHFLTIAHMATIDKQLRQSSAAAAGAGLVAPLRVPVDRNFFIDHPVAIQQRASPDAEWTPGQSE